MAKAEWGLCLCRYIEGIFMNESNEIHRDIYVGMVAEEMAQSGYYGEDVTLYGFLANGEDWRDLSAGAGNRRRNFAHDQHAQTLPEKAQRQESRSRRTHKRNARNARCALRVATLI